jgi:hypothetical protein
MKFSQFDKRHSIDVDHIRICFDRRFFLLSHSHSKSKTIDSHRHRRMSRRVERQFSISILFATVEKTLFIRNIHDDVDRHFVVSKKSAISKKNVHKRAKNSIVSKFHHAN